MTAARGSHEGHMTTARGSHDHYWGGDYLWRGYMQYVPEKHWQ